MDIEELARTRPEALRRVHVDPMLGVRMYHVRELTGNAAARGARGCGRHPPEALRAAGRAGRHARRGQPARPARGRSGRGAGREGHDRRQRAVPPRRTSQALKAAFPIDPVEARARDAGPAVREARRRGRDHRQRRGPGDVDAGRRGAGGRQGRELPGCRGRRERRDRWPRRSRSSCRTPRSRPSSSTSSAASRGATWWRRASWKRSSASTRTCRSWFAWTGRTPRLGREILSRGGAPADRPGDDHARGRRRRPPISRTTGRPHERLRRRATRGSWCRGSRASEGTFHTLRNRAYGTQVVAGVTPGKAGRRRGRHPRVRHGGGRRRARRAPTRR